MRVFPYGETEVQYLSSRDPLLGQAIARIGRIERPLEPDLFAPLASGIVSQQVSKKAAATVWKRMQARFGAITATTLCEAGLEELQQCGLSWRKAGCILNAARAVAYGELDLEALPELDDEEVIRRLTALPGIGLWTAEMILIFSLQRPDILSWGDLAIRRGMAKLYGEHPVNREMFERHRRCYSPYGSVASLYLWRIAVEE